MKADQAAHVPHHSDYYHALAQREFLVPLNTLGHKMQIALGPIEASPSNVTPRQSRAGERYKATLESRKALISCASPPL